MKCVIFINRFKILILAVGLLSIVAGLASIKDLNLDPSLETRFLKDNRYLNSFKEFNKEFGPEPLLVVVWKGNEDIWSLSTFNRLRVLTDSLEKIPGIVSVYSLSNLIDAGGINTDVNTTKQLPLVKKLFVSTDGKSQMLLMMPMADAIAPSTGHDLTRDIKRVLNDFVIDGESAYLSGALAMQSEAIDLSRDDFLRAIIFVSIFAILIFAVIYRSYRALLGSLMVAAFSIGGACFFLSASGMHLSQFALIAFPILAAISLQNVVHLTEHYDHARSEDEDPVSACHHMMRGCVVPCLWNSLTTFIGFASIMISDIEQVNSIGRIVVIGLPLAFIASVLFIPSLLMTLTGWPRSSRKLHASVVDGTVSYIFRHARLIGTSFLVFALFGLIGFKFVKMQFDFPNVFSEKVEFQKNLSRIDDDFGGAASFELMLKTNDGSDFSDLKKIELVRSLQMALSLTASVTETISPIDVGLTGYVLKNGMPSNPQKFKKDAGKFIKEILNENSTVLSSWLSPDLKKARIYARVRMDRNKYYDQLVSALSYLKDSFSKSGIDVSWSGFSFLYKDMEKRMLKELVESFVIAFIGVALFMAVLFRSFKWGLLAMIPNILPIVTVVGIMGIFGVGFSLGLVILPAIGLGLIVDNTIHIIWNVRKMLKEGYDLKETFTSVFSSTGRALVLTTLIVSAGFVSLVFSPFVSNFKLSIFMTALLLLALFFDLIFVPILVLCYYEFAKRGLRASFEMTLAD